MPSHATWADSLGWSHSPMREEAGLSYPAIESFAERPAIGEGEKRCDRVIGVQNHSPPLPPPRTPHRAQAESPYVTAHLSTTSTVVGFLWVPQNIIRCCYTCLCFF